MIPEEECYSLEKVILLLENIYFEKQGTFNLPKAIYMLAQEIKKLKNCQCKAALQKEAGEGRICC